jgi:hypothetical protein
MPMIDVYAAAGTFSDPHNLAHDLAGAVMRWEQVPDLALFCNNTAAFVHDMPAESIANVMARATTYASRSSRRSASLTGTNNSASSRNSPTSSQPRREILRSSNGPGSC